MDKHLQELIETLEGTPEVLRALVANRNESQLQKGGASAEDEWSVAEIVAHLVDAEDSWMVKRMRMMREQDRPEMDVYPNWDYATFPLSESLARFTELRFETVAYLRGLSDEDWSRSGRHVRWGEIDILWAVHHIAAHDAQHLAQIARGLTLP